MGNRYSVRLSQKWTQNRDLFAQKLGPTEQSSISICSKFCSKFCLNILNNNLYLMAISETLSYKKMARTIDCTPKRYEFPSSVTGYHVYRDI